MSLYLIFCYFCISCYLNTYLHCFKPCWFYFPWPPRTCELPSSGFVPPKNQQLHLLVKMRTGALKARKREDSKAPHARKLKIRQQEKHLKDTKLPVVALAAKAALTLPCICGSTSPSSPTSYIAYLHWPAWLAAICEQQAANSGSMLMKIATAETAGADKSRNARTELWCLNRLCRTSTL